MTRPHLNDIELLARLVFFDSTSRRSNRPLAEWICDYLDRPGVEIIHDVAPDGDKCNLAIRIGPEVDPETRGGLVLSGHMDVVPADEPDWLSEPFSLTERDDRLYARGSADMKGFLALATNLFSELDPPSLRRPLVLLLTYDEELGCLGAQHWVENGPKIDLPRSAIIGEPTELRVVRRHKGHLKAQVRVRGVSAHSGYPHLGVNAIERAADTVGALAALKREMEDERLPSSADFPEVPYPALNIGTIEGGSAINIVPDRCDIGLGMRMLPGMTSDAVIERLRATLEAVTPNQTPDSTASAVSESDVAPQLDLISASPPMEVASEAPIHRLLCSILGQGEGGSVHFATDAGWFQQLDLDCVIWGPGSIEVAHKPNEFVPIADLVRAREVLEQVVRTTCIEVDS